ncbi:MAG: tol-pal system-associated acyl-CoA thioesterase [Rickettsiales bacterium]|nr:tol-pal system-associated acyl-CoA thioesterase [Rickettsiales bacterium]
MSEYGQIARGVHTQDFTVYYEDTDAGGVVYYANYLKFAERARSDALKCLKIKQRELAANDNLFFVVSHCNIDYLSPAKLEDRITVQTRLLEMRKVRMTMEQKILRDETPLAQLEVTIVMLNQNHQPARLPQAIATTLQEALTIQN